MHARYADERRSRWEGREESERVSTMDDPYARSHRNGRRASPVSMLSGGNQQYEDTFGPPRTVASLSVGGNLNSSPPSSRASRRRRENDSSALPGLVSPSDSSSPAANNKYKDREMRLHQSIIYNRARLKQQQKYQQRAEQEHSSSLPLVSPDRGTRSTVNGTPSSTSSPMHSTRSRSPASSTSSSRVAVSRWQNLSDGSNSSRRNHVFPPATTTSITGSSPNNSNTRIQSSPSSQSKQEERRLKYSSHDHERNGELRTPSRKQLRDRDEFHHEEPQQNEQQPQLEHQNNDRDMGERPTLEHNRASSPEITHPQGDDYHESYEQNQEDKWKMREQHQEEERKMQDYERLSQEQQRLLEEQQRLLQEQEDQQRADEEERLFMEQQRQYHLDDQEVSELQIPPPPDEGESVLSGFSKPFDERHIAGVGASSVLSGYSKPFDEKQESKSSHHEKREQFLPMSLGVRHGEISTTPNAPPTLSQNASFPSHAPSQLEQSGHGLSQNRFKLPPPRVSEPEGSNYNGEYFPPSTPKAFVKQINSRTTHNEYYGAPKQRENDEDDNISPSVIDASLFVNEPSSPQLSPDRSHVSNQLRASLGSRTDPRNTGYGDDGEDEKKLDIVIPPPHPREGRSTRRPDFILNQDDTSRDETEDDSLFGYLTEQSKHREEDTEGSSTGNRRYSHNFLDTTDDDDFDDDDDEEEEDDDEGDDSTSVETPRENQIQRKASASPGSLPRRSQEAWKRHAEIQKHNARKTAQEELLNKNKVSFGKVDTVHTYQNERNNSRDKLNTTNDSIESGYTKSLESEVEDVFKDIFLIGSGRASKPGRRKPKDAPEKPPPDDDTFESTDDGSSDKKPSVKNKKESNDEDEDPLLTGMWNMMESSVGALGGALGILNPDDDETTIQTAETGPTMESSVDPMPRRKPLQPPAETKAHSRDDSPPRSTSQRNAGSPSPRSSTRDVSLLEYVSESFLGSPERRSLAKNAFPKDPFSNDPDIVGSSPFTEPYSSRNEPASSSDQDLRLAQLSTEAARMFHKIHGYDFDDKKEVDIVNEIKFVVVDLRLPMGVVFQENQGGCWIKKILPDGLGAQKPISVGDQLAAIDGVNAAGMKVDQIADFVRKKNGEFELTLLRYIGKLRPAVEGSDAGFEIKARNATITRNRPSSQGRAESVGRANSRGKDSLVREIFAGRRNQRAITPSQRRSDKQDQPISEAPEASPRGKRRFVFFGRRRKNDTS